MNGHGEGVILRFRGGSGRGGRELICDGNARRDGLSRR